MKIRLLTIAHQSPQWIKEGYQDYIKRLPPSWPIEHITLPKVKYNKKTDIQRLLQLEGEKMLSLIKPHHHVIALDVQGSPVSTEQFATHLASWQQKGDPIVFLIGSAEGLAPACLKRANEKWSLSALTFPHLLVPLILAEQFYRAWSILHQHPYHR